MKNGNECESKIVLDLTRQIELLGGRPLTETEREGLKESWAQNCAAFANMDATSYVEIITPFVSTSRRRIGLVRSPSGTAPSGVAIVARETGPVLEEVSHD